MPLKDNFKELYSIELSPTWLLGQNVASGINQTYIFCKEIAAKSFLA